MAQAAHAAALVMHKQSYLIKGVEFIQLQKIITNLAKSVEINFWIFHCVFKCLILSNPFSSLILLLYPINVYLKIYGAYGPTKWTHRVCDHTRPSRIVRMSSILVILILCTTITVL